MATKDPTVKIIADVASDDSKQEHAEKKAENKSTVKEEHTEKEAGLNVVASDDHSIMRKKEAVKTETKIKSVVASDKIIDHISEDEEDDDDDDEQETGIDLGISMDKLNLGPKKKLLVLPIGGFLVHRAYSRRPKTIPKNRQPDFTSGNFMIYKRPFCEEFLKFCFERFEVGIWSSALEHNISGVLTSLMGELKNKLLFTWDQDECTETDFMCLDNKYKPVFLKELDHIWYKKYTYSPWSIGEYSACNTLLISDPVKALLNPPNTGIFPTEYDPKNYQDDFLGPNGKLRVFLDGLAEAKDVQTYVKDHRIGEPAITPSHAGWSYYSKIISSYDKTN